MVRRAGGRLRWGGFVGGFLAFDARWFSRLLEEERFSAGA